MKKLLKKYDLVSLLCPIIAFLGPFVVMGVIAFIALLLKIERNNFILTLSIFFILIVFEMILIIVQSNARHRIKEKKKKGSWIPLAGIVICFLIIIYYLLNAYTYIKEFY